MFPLRFLYSMGIGGVVVTLLAAIVALVALPALLAVLGERVNALALPGWKRATAAASQDPTSGGWYRLSRAVMRRPGTIAVASAVVLIVLGLPFLGINFTTADSSSLGADSPVRQVDETLRSEFPDLATRSLTVVAEAPRSDAGAVAAYARGLGRLDDVTGVDRPRPLGPDAWTIRLLPRGDAADDTTQDLVTDLRAAPAPFPTAVDGAGARFADQQDALVEHLPLALLIVVATTLLILFALTGSVLLPIKAVIMNLLTISAALGLLVLIFQDGRLEGLLDYTSQGALEATQPVLLCALAFGLSTDYGVFLLTRIKEARDARRRRTGGRGPGPAANRTDRDRGRAAVRRGDRRVRDVVDRVHQAAGRRHGARGVDRRLDRPRAARPVAHGADGALELVGTPTAAAAARAVRAA